jgi:hypothetical protein
VRFVCGCESGWQGQQEAEQRGYYNICFHNVTNRPLSLTNDDLVSRFLPDLNLLPF